MICLDRFLLSLEESGPTDTTEDDDIEGTGDEETTDDPEVNIKQLLYIQLMLLLQAVTTAERNPPLNVSTGTCLKPAVTQFPTPIINKKGRQKGGVIIHILVATYMFIGLAIVCDDYFVPALTRVSDGKGINQYFPLSHKINFQQ